MLVTLNKGNDEIGFEIDDFFSERVVRQLLKYASSDFITENFDKLTRLNIDINFLAERMEKPPFERFSVFLAACGGNGARISQFFNRNNQEEFDLLYAIFKKVGYEDRFAALDTSKFTIEQLTLIGQIDKRFIQMAHKLNDERYLKYEFYELLEANECDIDRDIGYMAYTTECWKTCFNVAFLLKKGVSPKLLLRALLLVILKH